MRRSCIMARRGVIQCLEDLSMNLQSVASVFPVHMVSFMAHRRVKQLVQQHSLDHELPFTFSMSR